MSDSVQVAGLLIEGENPHGLDESLAEFRSHHEKTGSALLNISGVGTLDGKPKRQHEPRKPYDPKAPENQWPQMMYHADGGQVTVFSEKEKADMRKKNYRDESYPKPQVALADPKAEKIELQRKLTQKDGEITSLTDLVQKLTGRLEALEANAK